MRGVELIPVAADRFQTQDGTGFAFEPAGAGSPPTLRVIPAGEQSAVYTRMQPAQPTARQLEEYAGKYWSDELEVHYLVNVKDGKLTARHRPEPEVILEPTYADGFAAAGEETGWLARFTRNKAGKIDGFTIYAGRVRHLKFSKAAAPAAPYPKR